MLPLRAGAIFLKETHGNGAGCVDKLPKARMGYVFTGHGDHQNGCEADGDRGDQYNLLEHTFSMYACCKNM